RSTGPAIGTPGPGCRLPWARPSTSAAESGRGASALTRSGRGKPSRRRTFSIGFADVGSLHIIEEGELVLRIDGDPHVEHVGRGDVVLLPRGDPHHVSDAGDRAHAIVRAGVAENDAPEPARWLCGTFTIGDPQASHLLPSLP